MFCPTYARIHTMQLWKVQFALTECMTLTSVYNSNSMWNPEETMIGNWLRNTWWSSVSARCHRRKMGLLWPFVKWVSFDCGIVIDFNRLSFPSGYRPDWVSLEALSTELSIMGVGTLRQIEDISCSKKWRRRLYPGQLSTQRNCRPPLKWCNSRPIVGMKVKESTSF